MEAVVKYKDFERSSQSAKVYYPSQYTLIFQELYAQRALKIVKYHKRKQPLFLYLSFQAPHIPLQVYKILIFMAERGREGASGFEFHLFF